MKHGKVLIVLTMALSACSPVDDPTLFPEFDPRTAVQPHPPEASGYDARRNLYWGDLHVHTSYSTDAWTNGVRASPDDAYRFFKGGEIAHAAGYGIRLKRPLDFAAVTDHAEYLGVLRATDPDNILKVRGLRERLLEDGRLRNTLILARTMIGFDLQEAIAPGWQDLSRAAWRDIVGAAERHNEPGRFSAFVAYEWSSMPEARNLHRNVIYRDARVPQPPQQLGLVAEPLPGLFGLELDAQQFQRDPTMGTVLPGLVDAAHAAGREQAHDLVAADA